MAKSFKLMSGLSLKDLNEIFKRIKNLKPKIKARKTVNNLNNKIIGILFEKPSTRTRAGFEAAALRLGGKAMYMQAGALQLSRGEPIKDAARILGGYTDALVARVYSQSTIEEFAEYAGVPVINALSDLEHPTQCVCDLFTILEEKRKLKGLTLVFIGDGNNVCNSLLTGCAMTGMNMTVSCPEGYYPDKKTFENALKIAKSTGSKIKIVENPEEAVKEADILYTDVWVSMGEDKEAKKKEKLFKNYQINSKLLKSAKKDACVMHCLPAHRGMEITDDVIEGKQSIVWEQGQNKLYSAAGILDYFLR